MKKILFIGFFWGVIGMSFSQIITIKDKESQQAIEFATIKKDSLFVQTNAKGQADISEFQGLSEIEIHFMGYKSQVKSYEELQALSFQILLEDAVFNLDEVVISATRWRQSTKNVPSKIVSVSRQQVKLQNPQTAADLLAISGKVFIQKSQQGGGSPIIRGFATNRLLYTVDGIRMNTAIFRGGNIQNVISLDPFAIENTEVFLGASSVIYGSDAIGGVMNFQTLLPELSLNDTTFITGKAVTRYSSANQEKTGHFDVNIGFKKWAFLTSFSSFNYDDLRMGSHGPKDYLKPYYIQRQDSVDVIVTNNDPKIQHPTGYSQMNIMQKVRFQPSKKWDFQYGFHYSETSDYGRYDRYTQFRKGLPRYAEWNYGPQKWMMNSLIITHENKTVLYDQISIRLAHQSFEESRISRAINNNLQTVQKEKVFAYSTNIDFVKKISEKNTLFYGTEYIMNDVISTGFVNNIATQQQQKGPARYPKATWQSMAVYLNNQYKLNEKILLQTGLRYNHFKINTQFDTTFYKFPFTTAQLNNGALTGAIGAIYRPSKTWILSTNFSTAFRSPNVDDMGKVFDSQPNTMMIPNPKLKAEYAYTMDLNLTKVIANQIKIDITGYYTLLENALVRRNFQLNGMDSIVYEGEMSQVQAIQNAAVAKVYGIEAGIEIKLPQHLTFSSDINYQKGTEELDNKTVSPSRHAVPLFGASRLTYRFNKLSMQINCFYQAERKFENLAYEEQGKTEIYAKDANGKSYSPAWYTLNIKTMYQLTPVWGISTGIENITDQRYRSYSSGIAGAGRNFVMAVNATF